MDAIAQLALADKARKVFGGDDTVLSFPVTPLPSSAAELDFRPSQDADVARRRQHNLCAFSTLVNTLPDGEAWLPDGTRFLWDVLAQVLREADFAASSRDAQEESRYRLALERLRLPDGGDTPAVQSYRRCKDAFLLAQQAYLALKCTADSSDKGQQARWKGEEGRLRSALQAAEEAWHTEGSKDMVEAARAEVAALAGHSPIQAWADWRARFNADIDTLSDGATTVYPSYLTPENALDEGSWRSFLLSGDEIAASLRDATPQVREGWGVDPGQASAVRSMSFEFSSAAVLRPWFAPEVFITRSWRFANATRFVCDGATPPEGSCTAYVRALVFARRVRINTRPRQDGSAVAALDTLHFSAIAKQRPLAVAREPAHPLLPVLVQPVPIRMPARPVILTRAPMQLGAVRAIEAPAVPPAAPPQDDAIFVLAFICKKVPRCPDPDPSLRW